jgi:hypothetical protein
VEVCPKKCLAMEIGHSSAMRTRDREFHLQPAPPPPVA